MLEMKLEKRDKEKRYKTLEDIYSDIVDLSGARISLFFPSDRNLVGKVITEIFSVKDVKEFKGGKQIPNYEKRFSGYWASHYRVHLMDNDIDERYKKSLVEIQVGSVLMLAWSEIEHDLIYKPSESGISNTELAILDELNGMVLAGEIALERLKEAITERIEKNKKFNDNYEISNYIIKNIGENDIEIGNTKILMNLLTASGQTNINNINKFISNKIFQKDYSISDQIIDDLLIRDYDDKKVLKALYDYINKNLKGGHKNGFEKFIKAWILIEKTVRSVGDQLQKKMTVYSNEILKILDNDESSYSTILYCRKVRNELIHGVEPYENKKLKELADKLLQIVRVIILKIDDIEVRENLEKELNGIE
jgi:ppGpp synthetase/RelA/SpoT-type nucleotidyltranferase